MYHYQKNIGDYRSATMHLSLLEHGIYNQLLDWYYLDECPLSLDNRTLFRRLSARSEIEQQAVLDVLSEMFVQTDGGWVQKRVEREISQYRAKANQARAAGKLGGRPPKNGIGSENNRDGFEKEPDAKLTANHEPLTKNQEPVNTTPPEGGVSRKRSAATTAARPDDVSEPVWQDFQRLRREKRAPLTDTALAGVRREAEKAGVSLEAAIAYCCEAGWQGFNAGWYADRQGGAHTSVRPPPQGRYSAAAATIFGNNQHPEVIDV